MIGNAELVEPVTPSGGHLTPARFRALLARDRDRLSTFAASVPVWAWLVVLVAAATAAQLVYVRRLAAPWIFPDELIYSELARSLAAGGEPAIREIPSLSYGILYSLLLAPAYALFDRLPDAYAAAKATNALLMSLAAVPAYLLARRLLSRGWAFLAGVLAIAVPSSAYAGMLMTENAFYPVFLAACVAMVATLERPTSSRQLVLLAAMGAAFAVRAQAVVLVPALMTAAFLVAALDARSAGSRASLGRLAGPLRTLRLTWLALGLVAAGLGGGALVAGKSPVGLLGAYRSVLDDLSFGEVPRWFVLHLAELDLYLGVLPFAAAGIVAVGALRDRNAPRELRVFAAVALALVFWMTLLVSTFATQPLAQLVHERSLFYVAPLFLSLFLVWVSRRVIPSRTALLVAGGVSALLPLLLPFRDLVYSSVFEALALVPWSNTLVEPRLVPPAMSAAAATLVALFLLGPRRLVVLAPIVVLLNFYVVGVAARTQIERASYQASAALGPRHDWIDRALEERGVPTEVQVAALWWQPVGRSAVWHPKYFAKRRAIWLSEFFNRRVGRVLHVGARMPYNLPDDMLEPGRRGELRASRGSPARPVSYLVASPDAGVIGTVLASDRRSRLRLYRIAGALRVSPAGATRGEG